MLARDATDLAYGSLLKSRSTEKLEVRHFIKLIFIKLGLANFDIRKNVEHFLGWLSSNLSIQKSPTAEI